MKPGQVTIKDIARHLNISVSTVSRALSDHPDISDKTKKQVREIAERYGYHPNGIARSLKKRHSNTIGVILPEIRHHFFSSVLNGIEDITYKAGYTIIVAKSNERYEREVVNTRALVSNQVAGLLVSVSQETEKFEHFCILQQRGIPIVFFDRVLEDVEASKVLVDDFGGSFRAVEHLLKSGYRRIAHLAGPEFLTIGKERLHGYKAALEKYEIPFLEQYVIHGGLEEADGIRGLQMLSELPEKPDAIFAINDPVAIGVFMELKKRGLKVPRDMALIGFSDNPICTLIDPPMTSVYQPAYDMGTTAAQLLLEEIENKTVTTQHRRILLETRLMIRQST